MTWFERDVLPILLIAGLFLGLSAILVAFGVAVVRLESYRIRRGFSFITSAFSKHTKRPASVGPAFRLESHEGERAGYRVATSFGLGSSIGMSGSAGMPGSLRSLHVTAEITKTESAIVEEVGPSLSDRARRHWSEPGRVHVDVARGTARFTCDLPYSRRDAERFWFGVRYAAEQLAIRSPTTAPTSEPTTAPTNEPTSEPTNEPTNAGDMHTSSSPESSAASTVRQAPKSSTDTEPESGLAVPEARVRAKDADAAPATKFAPTRHPRPTWIQFEEDHPSDEQLYVLAATTNDAIWHESTFVGPFRAVRAEAAWSRLEREFAYAGGTFFVFACLSAKSMKGAKLEVGAAAVMQERTIFSIAEVTSLERYVVATTEADGVVLDEHGNLPTYDDAAGAIQGAHRTGERALALVALRSVFWHAHM